MQATRKNTFIIMNEWLSEHSSRQLCLAVLHPIYKTKAHRSFAEISLKRGFSAFENLPLDITQSHCLLSYIKKFLSNSTANAEIGEEFCMSSSLLQRFGDKSVTKEAIYKSVAADFSLLPELIQGTASTKASIRYGCGSILLNLSAQYPKQMYPYLDEFISLLYSDYRILVWNGLGIVANLCCVDKDRKFEAIFDKYFGFLKDEYMVTVANVVGNSGKIALAKPDLIPRIMDELLSVERAALTPHLTEECKRVIAEQAVESFDEFFEKMSPQDQSKAVAFVKRHVDSPRKGLRKSSGGFLKRWNK